MDRKSLAELLARQPFQPFVIKLSSGESVEVRHPELAALGRALLIVINPKTDRTSFVSLLHIVSVESTRAA
jgi:hypothetical protein